VLAGREVKLLFEALSATVYTFIMFFRVDHIITENVRLEIGSLEQQLLLSYDSTEIRGLVEKLVAANPMKPQWRISNKV
jgi:hypothetical protein